MSYRDFKLYRLTEEIVIEIHKMALTELPKFKRYEEDSRICRPGRSVKPTIAAEYSRRQYPKDYIKFIIDALSSNDETVDHLTIRYTTGSLMNIELHEHLLNKLNLHGKKLNRFLQVLEKFLTFLVFPFRSNLFPAPSNKEILCYQ